MWCRWSDRGRKRLRGELRQGLRRRWVCWRGGWSRCQICCLWGRGRRETCRWRSRGRRKNVRISCGESRRKVWCARPGRFTKAGACITLQICDAVALTSLQARPAVAARKPAVAAINGADIVGRVACGFSACSPQRSGAALLPWPPTLSAQALAAG